MSSLKSKSFSALKAFAFTAGVLSLSSCQELGSETATAPLRPVDITRSTVTVTNSSAAEVAVSQTATVRLADKRGAGIMGLQPKITLVDSGGTVPAGVTAGTCTATESGGNATCQVSSSVPGTFWVKVLQPSSFVTTRSVTFVQKLNKFEFTVQPTCVNCVMGTTFNATARALDRAGQPITSGPDSTPSVSVALTSAGGATLAGTTTATAAAGLASFTGLNINKIGTYTLTASSGGFSGTSGSFTVVAGAPTKILFTTQPGSGAASNRKITPAPVVGLFDANDNPVSATNCSITLSLVAGSGTLLGTSTMTTVAGVANFDTKDIRVNTAAGGSNFQLRAAVSGSGACGLIPVAGRTVDSSLFSVTLSGVPYQLAIVVPPSAAAMSQIFPTQPQVQILDVDGNVVTNDSSSVVTITKSGFTPSGSGSGSGANLVGPSSVQALNGVVNFANLFIDSTNIADEGTYSYTFAGNAPGITLVPTTASHLVTADGNRGPFRLEFFQQPTPVSRNQVMPAVKVRKIDSNGYLNFTDNTTTVTLAMSPAGGTLNNPGPITLANGVATFDNLSVSGTTGVKTLSTSSSDASLTNATSSGFAISNYSNPVQLRFVGPINENHSKGNTPWNSPPVVHVQDSANNTVANDSTTVVTLDIVQYSNPPTGNGKPTLMGSISKTVSNGIATFPDLYTSQYNVTNIVLSAVSNNGLSPAQSVTFNGNSSVPAALRFVDQPVFGIKTGTVDRCWISKNNSSFQPIAVEIVDSAGNRIVSDSTTQVTVACNSCGLAAGSGTVTVDQGLATFTGLQTTDDNKSVSLTATAGSLPAKVSNSFTLPECVSP